MSKSKSDVIELSRAERRRNDIAKLQYAMSLVRAGGKLVHVLIERRPGRRFQERSVIR